MNPNLMINPFFNMYWSILHQQFANTGGVIPASFPGTLPMYLPIPGPRAIEFMPLRAPILKHEAILLPQPPPRFSSSGPCRLGSPPPRPQTPPPPATPPPSTPSPPPQAPPPTLSQTPPIKCPDCNQIFLLPSVFERHYRSHSGEKPYQCTICSRRFSQKGNLATHRLTHGDKHFDCHHCGKSFFRKDTLQKHIQTHTKEHFKQFKCDFCGKRFSSKYYLKVHCRVHISETPLDLTKSQ